MTPKQQSLYNSSQISTLGFTPPMEDTLYCSVLRTKGGSGESWGVAIVSGYLRSLGHNVLIVRINPDRKYGSPSWTNNSDRNPDQEALLRMMSVEPMDRDRMRRSEQLGSLVNIQEIPSTTYKCVNTEYNWENDCAYMKELISSSHFTAVILTHGLGSAINASTMYCALENTSRVILTLNSKVPDCHRHRDQLVNSFENYGLVDWDLRSLEWTRRGRERHELKLHQHFINNVTP